MKKVFIVLGIAIGIIILVLISWFFFAVTGAFSIFMSNPPRPEITYGEFPISIIYEVDGETKVIDDVVICEFDGFESRGTAGKYRKWKSRLKSGNESLAFFPVEQNVIIEVGIFRGFPNYYMGDYSERSKEDYEKSMADEQFMEYVEWKNGVKTGRSFSKEEVWEKYKLKILDVQYSQPIHNSFK